MSRLRLLGRTAAVVSLAVLAGCGAATEPPPASVDGPGLGPRETDTARAHADGATTAAAATGAADGPHDEAGAAKPPHVSDRASPSAHAADGSSRTAAKASGAAPLLRLERVDRVVDAPIASLAIDPDRGLAAALGSDAWMFDGTAWRAIPIPAELRPKAGERDQVRIHFGRDHLPRIMGNRFDAEGPRQLYLRFRHGAWRTEVRELAAFGSKPRGALYGVLGWDDPEVVCKAGEFCLVKQRKGWSQVPLPARSATDVVRIDLAEAGAYALLRNELLRLGDSSWSPVGDEGPWKGAAAGAWISPTAAWVSAPEEDALYRHDGTGWRRVPSPAREPRGLWGSAEGGLWIAGRDGVGYLDGKAAWHVAGIDGPTSEIVGHGERLWVGGSGGLWQATVRTPTSPPRSAGKGASTR